MPQHNGGIIPWKKSPRAIASLVLLGICVVLVALIQFVDLLHEWFVLLFRLILLFVVAMVVIKSYSKG